MLQFLRKKGNIKKIMWGLAVVIIPAFVLWGSGSAVRSRGKPKYAGKIFDKKVSFRQYEASLRACKNQALLIYGEDLNKIAKYLNLEQEAWERLILLHQAKKEKIKASDQEVIDFIEKVPLFQKEGRFDQKRYNILLDYAFHASPRDFEEQIREALKIDKLRSKVMDKVSVSDEEIEIAYKDKNEKARALYVFVDPQKFTGEVHPAFEQLQQYYSDHKVEFKKPQQVNVEYIALYYGQAGSEAAASEEETKTALEDKIWQISGELSEDPASFENAAEKHQLEIEETGFFGPQQVIPEIGLSYEFLNTAFSLKIDELSNVIETPKGYFIIKVKEKKQPYIPELDQIEQEVEDALIKEKSWQLAKSKGGEISAQIKKLIAEENLSFPKAAEKLSLTVKETEEFSKISYVSGIGQSRQFTSAAFALEPGEVSELITVSNGYCILSLKNIIPIEQEKFAQEKEEFAKKVLARKKEMHHKIWLDIIKMRANLVSNLD